MRQDKITSPGQILDITSAYWKSCTLHAAVMLDVFTAIGASTATASEVADRLAVGDNELLLLLNALTAMGLLVKNGDRFGNSKIAAASLVKGAPGYLGHIIAHHHHLVDGWAQLADAIKKGGPVHMRDFGEEAERESFLLGMHNLAMANAPLLAKEIDLKDRSHLLDLGGGPGTYAIHFCLANPELRATIFDRPTTEEYARRTTSKFGVGDRVSFIGGDFTAEAIHGRYDAVWMSQILHSNGPKTCREIIGNAVTALQPGGIVMIHEFFLDDTMAAPLFPALFSLNMLINNGVGRSYSAGEIADMLRNENVRDIHRLTYQGPNDSYVLCGTV